MTTRTDDARTLLATVLRVLVVASRVAMALPRALVLCVGIVAVTFGIEREYGRVMGILAVIAWVTVGAAVIVVLNRRDSR